MNNEISGKTLLSVTASIAATIIPDTPIVSIAGATLSEITTTTTSTTTTPTPTPTPTAFLPSIRANKDHGDITNLPKNPMSDAAVNKSAGGNGNAAASQTTTAINASAAADGASIAGKNSSIDYAPIENTTVNAGKTDDAPTNTTTTTDTKISDVSDLEEPELKKLLDEAYSYKAPKDKKDKSEIFLDLLQKVENEDLGIISTRSESHRHHPHSQSRHQQKQGGSLQDLLQLPSDYRRQNHTSRHKKNSSVSSRQREGGSLPSNVNVANCLLSSFGQQTNVYTDKRVRRGIFPGVDTALNSNKTLVGVVGLSVGDPNANCLLSTIEQHTDKPARRVVGLAGGDPTTASGVAAGTVAGGSGGLNSVSLCSEESGSGGVGASVTTVSGGAGSMATTASGHNVGGTMATGTGLGNSGVKSVNSIGGSSDYIINIGDMIDIQQQQQILPSKTQDYGQILSYYDRVDIDLHIPHRSIRGDFVPARSHHYVDEVIRFPQIDGGADGSLCESGEVAISVNNLGNTLKSAAASCSLPMPLDERYRSIKSVMGEKGDVAGVGASLNAGVAGSKTSGATVIPNAGSISSVNASNNAGGVGVGVGSNGIGIGGYAKALPMSRQTDENGNDCERQQHASIVVSSTGQSQAKAKAKKKPQKDNTIPVDVVNEAGYRGKDPVEVLVKFIESTEEDGKQGGGSGNSKVAENSKKKERKKEKVKQSKMKKSNSLEELRSCAKIDVGELKRSAVTTESNNVTMRSKGSGGSKSGKNNSSSTADINKNIDGGKEMNPTPAITTAGGGGGGKQAAAIVNATSNHRKGERRSWGTEELQYLGNEGGNNVINVIGNVEAERTRDKKEKRGKDKDKDKDRERDVEREKDKGKDRETDKHDKLPNTKSDGGNTKYEKYDKYEKLEKTDKSDKGEKAEKTDKSEKRKKSETIMQTPTANAHESQSVERANTPVISAIELLSMNTLISETAEFHVVTKKKKPKKQRASIDETHFAHNSYNSNSVTTGGFSRGTHSAPAYAQKGGSNNNNYTNNNNNNNNNVLQQQQQQQQSRYNKYHNNNAHGFNSYGNGGEDGRLDYRNNYNSNYNNYNSNHTHQNQQYGYQQQQQGQYHHHQHHLQHQQHQQQSHPVANAHNTSGGASSDKSRRKSTSSVPPSEKSDSSDLDSVHSLPIESTAASVTKSKPRHKTPVTSTTTSATASPETPKSVSSGGSPGSAPISYAHIAASAAAERWPSLDVANNNSTNAAINGTINAAEQPQQQQHMTNIEAAVSPPASTQSNSNNNSPTAVAVTAAATPNSASKQSKSKKAATKTDFPELIATSTSTTTTTVVGVPSVDLAKANATPSAATAVTGAAKTISYSQSLAATTAHQIPVANANNGVINEKLSGPSAAEAVVIPVNAQPACNYTVPDVNKVDTMSGSTARVPQHQPLMQQQQLQQQTLQKSKSVEHESYNYNSSNLDQQYPALEQTVKRHSATNVSISPPTGIATGINSTLISGFSLTANAPLPAANAASSNKFNFAAAAKQQVSKNVAGSPQGIITQEPLVPAQALHQPQFNASTTSGTPAVPAPASNAGTVPTAAVQVTMPARKSKEKSPTAVYAPAPVAVANNTSTQIAIGNVAPQTSEAGNVVKKNKKEKTYLPLAPDTLPLLTAVVEPHTVHVAQKSSTATQTQATSMDLAGSGSGSGKNTRPQPTLVAKSEAVILPPATAASKPQRQHAGKNNAVATASQTATHNASTTAAATGGTVGASSGNAPTTNRPAVIILNDDRCGDNSALGIEFTFGDFNEDELKFFDDNIAEEECAEDFNAEVVEPTPEQQSLQGKATVELIGSADISTNTTLRASKVEVPEEMLNEQKVKPSFVDVRATSPKPAPFNQAPVTGIAVARKEGSNKIKNIFATENVNTRPADKVYALLTSQISSDSNKEGGYAATVTVQPDVEQSQQHELPRRNSETLQLQQLETCNDIETVIIAAARRAAEQQQQLPQPMQPPPSQHQRSYRHKHQQQQYRSTSYGNAYEQAPQPQREQRSQSAYNRDAPNHYQSHHYHNQYHQQTQQQQQQQQQHYHYHQSGSSNSGASRSRSSSSNNNTNSYDASSNTPPPQSPIPSSAVMVNMQRKELDIHFIPPIVSNAYSAMQHNEIIVDFIGSAWEEVSKVTKFYEGQ